MIENSPLKHKTIYNSFTKLQRASSDGKFRVKSIRVKTLNNQMENHITQKLGLPLIYPNQSQRKMASSSSHAFQSPVKGSSGKNVKQSAKNVKIVEKNYQGQLNNIGVSSQFLRNIYEIKCNQNENKLTQQKFLLFVKNFALRLCKNKNLVIKQLGFGSSSLRYLLNWFVSWQGHVTELDLTYSSEMLKQQKLQIIKKLLQKDEKLMSIVLCNSAITGQEIQIFFKIINTRQQLFALDLSNINSQYLNRFGEDISIIDTFIKENESVAILKLNNTQLKQQGLEQICRGVSQRKLNPLKVICIANNHIIGSRFVGEHFHNLSKSGLLHLDISQNPLGDEFYKNLPVLKSTTVKELNLSATGMTSQQFYEFMAKIQESKSLAVLKVDKNDFSHHWFSKIGERIQTNNSLEWLSMNDCQIKSFMSVFLGLTQNKYLKKVHASNNAVDFDNQMIKKIKDCFFYNKDLQELRIRFCNLNDQILVQLFESIADNKKLKILDVSENLMQESGAEAILKMLEKNCKIQYLGIEKLQFSQQIRARVQHKMEQNKGLRERQQMISLQGISKDMKSIDQFTWQDVQNYENQCRALQEKYYITEKKVAKLEDLASDKRQKVIAYTKQVKNAQKQIQQSIKQKIRYQNERVRNAQRQASELEKLQNKIKNECTKQVDSINRLQEHIKKVNQQIKKRQNELEQLYRNHKYLQKKKKSKQKIDQNPQRKPSLGHNHGRQVKNQS